MAMDACKECGKDISSRAPVCPHCGARLRMHKGWWLLILPAGVLAAFLAIGFSIPDNVASAIAMRETCMTMIGGAISGRAHECDRIYTDRLNRK